MRWGRSPISRWLQIWAPAWKTGNWPNFGELNLPKEKAILPKERKIVELQDAVEEVESCSACYGYLIPALQKLKEEGRLKGTERKNLYRTGVQRKDRRTGDRPVYQKIPAFPEGMSAYGRSNL